MPAEEAERDVDDFVHVLPVGVLQGLGGNGRRRAFGKGILVEEAGLESRFVLIGDEILLRGFRGKGGRRAG